MNTPRFMNAFDIWTCFDKPINIKTFEDLKLDIKDIGLAGSPTKVRKTYTRPVMNKSPKVVMEPQDAAKKIIDLLSTHIWRSKTMAKLGIFIEQKTWQSFASWLRTTKRSQQATSHA